MGLRSAKVSVFGRGLAVSTALLLATAALGGLSIQSVYREAHMRKRLIADTHRSIADVVSARLDAAMLEADRAVAEEVQSIPPRTKILLDKLRVLEGAQPWLEPLVLIAAPPVEQDPVNSADNRFNEFFSSAERLEYRQKAYAQAALMYAKAAAQATAGWRAAALNGQARTELNAGDTLRAAGTYKKLISEADSLDRQAARISVIAREQLVSCYKILGNQSGLADAALDVYKFLIAHRFILDDDSYHFYRSRVDEGLAHASDPASFDEVRAHEQQLKSIEIPLDAASAMVVTTPIGDSGAKVAHVWTISNTGMLLERLLQDSGPWSDVGVALLEEGENPEAVRAALPVARAPKWRVAAFPRSGSVDTIASREVVRFAALVVLVFATVVTAMLLAARSVARELALSRTRSDFVASVSHELKTPLSLIRMFAESLREGWIGENKRKEYYEVITRESERLTGLINNVLDFSQIESGTRKYVRATADLRALLAELLGRYEYHLKAASIDLIEELPAEPVYAFVDRDAIEQVVVNLLSNAVKYMGDAERRPRNIRVSLSTSAEHSVIRIADTGIGMSDEDRLHIFERFWRADDEPVRAVAGSGLGLTLVKHIVEAHDGTIAVESVPGGGSMFAVTFPVHAGGRS